MTDVCSRRPARAVSEGGWTVSALLWLLIPLLAGIAASVWAWRTGRRTPAPPDHDIWADLDRYQRLRTVLSADDRCRTA